MGTAKTPLLVTVGVIALMALMLGSEAIVLVIIAVGVLIAVQVSIKRSSDGREMSFANRRWYMWLAGAGAAFLVGLGALVTDSDNNLNTVQWTTWMAAWSAAALLTAVGVFLGMAKLNASRR